MVGSGGPIALFLPFFLLSLLRLFTIPFFLALLLALFLSFLLAPLLLFS